ncbi:TetR/AcrR family transcriptional regulator [Mesorhizobium sp. M0028]|uniref:TetR/AcrR family transcriptional regulator n=2 Tax=unclassified Mesorhizobium TaxID=325217 RepID=UPI0033379677
MIVAAASGMNFGRDMRANISGSPGDEAHSTRTRIKEVAAEFYVLRGHDGFSFGDIATAIGTTRANIHHHFGNKRQLMEELIADFAANAEARIKRFWTTPDIRFFDRLDMQLEDLRRFYERFNAEKGARNMWSPLSRLRHDLPVLGEPAERALERVNRVYDQSLRHAVDQAVKDGELSSHTLSDELVHMLRITLLSCPPMTQDTGSFDEVARTFAALAAIIRAAWHDAGKGSGRG